MGVNSASSGGEAQIDLFEITSNYSGETVDIRQGISVVYVYESLFDSTVRVNVQYVDCLLYTSPSPRDLSTSRMPSSA